MITLLWVVPGVLLWFACGWWSSHAILKLHGLDYNLDFAWLLFFIGPLGLFVGFLAEGGFAWLWALGFLKNYPNPEGSARKFFRVKP